MSQVCELAWTDRLFDFSPAFSQQCAQRRLRYVILLRTDRLLTSSPHSVNDDAHGADSDAESDKHTPADEDDTESNTEEEYESEVDHNGKKKRKAPPTSRADVAASRKTQDAVGTPAVASKNTTKPK
jgi:hypothetical protein